MLNASFRKHGHVFTDTYSVIWFLEHTWMLQAAWESQWFWGFFVCVAIVDEDDQYEDKYKDLVEYICAQPEDNSRAKPLSVEATWSFK